jgi:glutamate racemase
MYSAEMTELLHSYLIPMIDADIDYLVLGCSHYPYLIPQIKEILPNHIQIIDSGEAVKKQSLLQEKSGLQQKKIVDLFYTNANPKY